MLKDRFEMSDIEKACIRNTDPHRPELIEEEYEAYDDSEDFRPSHIFGMIRPQQILGLKGCAGWSYSIYLYLLVQAREDSQRLSVTKSFQSMAEDLKCSRRQARRSVSELEAKGLIQVVSGTEAAGNNRPNTYLIPRNPLAQVNSPEYWGCTPEQVRRKRGNKRRRLAHDYPQIAGSSQNGGGDKYVPTLGTNMCLP